MCLIVDKGERQPDKSSFIFAFGNYPVFCVLGLSASCLSLAVATMIRPYKVADLSSFYSDFNTAFSCPVL